MEPEKSLVGEFLRGGWIIPLVGASAMIARLLSTQNHGYGWVEQLKRVFTASIASSIVWVMLDSGVVMSPSYITPSSQLSKAIIYGVVGVISPEIISGMLKLGAKFHADPGSYFKWW
jgi:hypothetical protein